MTSLSANDDYVLVLRSELPEKKGTATRETVQALSEVKVPETTRLIHASSAVTLNRKGSTSVAQYKGSSKNVKSMLLGRTIPQALAIHRALGLRDAMGTNAYTFRMTIIQTLTSDAGGILSGGLSNNPASGYSEWTSEISALFDEFRVLSGRTRFIPRDRFNKALTPTTTTTGLIVFYDNDSTTAPAGSAAAAWTYTTAKPCSVDDCWEYSWRRPNVTASAYWDDVATPSSSLGGMFWQGGGFTAVTTYGNLYYEIEVQLRGRR